MNLDELLLFMDLRRGQGTLVAAVTEDDGGVDAARNALAAMLRAASMKVGDLGLGDAVTGPRRWAQLTAVSAADAYLIGHVPATPVAARAWAALVNGEREMLRELGGPLVLVMSRATEQILQRHAIDFTTWINQVCVLPPPSEMGALARLRGAEPTVVESVAAAEDPIRFLHVSDFHLRALLVKRYDQDKVLRGLVEFLARDREGFPLDLVFVTGDLAQSGRAEEYGLVADLLGKLMEVTGVPAERFFVVPGNHDVDRDVGKWLLRTPAKGEDADAFFVEAKNRAFHAQKHAAYVKAMGALLGEKRPLGLGVGEDAVELVEVRDAKIAVASFNSAWFAQDDGDRGKLWLGEACVDKAGQRVGDLGVPFALALMHHPTEDLHEEERSNVESYLERSFDLVLRGHLHREKTRSIATQRGGYVEVAGPAAYQGSRWPNGCFLGEIRPKARSVKLRPYAYAAGPDPWVLDAKVFPDDEADAYCRTFVVPEKKRLPSAIVRQREKASDERVRTASLAVLRQLAESLGVVEARAELPKDVVEKTAKAARAHGESAGLWADQRLDAEDQSFKRAKFQALSSLMPISRDNPQFLKEGLQRVAMVFSRVRSWAASSGAWTEERAWQISRETLHLCVDGPTNYAWDDEWLIQLYGYSQEADQQHAVVVYGAPGLPVLGASPADGLQVVDTYLERTHAAHGALILVDPPGPTDTEPHPSQVKTPAGRDVWLLRL
jgi:hypothetical protein